jgi:hypothetical protein
MFPTAHAIPQFARPDGRGRVGGRETVLDLTHRYERSTVRQLTDAPGAHPAKACGHVGHVGTCPACQRTNAKRMAEQLTAATLARQAWLASRSVVEQSMRAA